MSIPDSAATLRNNAAVEVINPNGQFPVLHICECASSDIPEKYCILNLDSSILIGHIAWKPSAFRVVTEISGSLDAQFMARKISRLVFEGNIPPKAPGAIPSKSEIYDFPINSGISEIDRKRRIRLVYESFHKHSNEMIADRAEFVAIVSIFSYNLVYLGRQCEDNFGILHNDNNSRMTDAILAVGRSQGVYPFTRNELYGAGDGVMHTILRHAFSSGTLNAMIKICNDWIISGEAQKTMANYLSGMIETAIEELTKKPMELRCACH